MPDEIKGTNAVSASSDADSLFYLLKITGRAVIGNRDSDGTVKEFFDEDDIGVIQSTALLQDFNTDEFIEIPGSTNDKWLNGDSSTNPPWGGLNGGQLTITALGIPMSASWSVGVTDRETELNAVNAIKTAYESPVPNVGVPFSHPMAWPLWGTQLRDALSTSHNDFLLANNPAQLVAVFQGIIDGKSYVSFPGSNFKFVNAQSSNVIDALNKMYAPTLDGQKSVVNGISTLKDFFTVESFVETQINRTQNIFGPVFSSDTFWNEYQSLTNTSNLTSGVAQNFLLIQEITGQLSTGLSFTGLMDTPTGFESGKFLVANETGLEWTDIEDPVLSFTGLSDTPTGYDEGKILQSTTTGLAWVDMPIGGGGGGSSTGLGIIGYGSVDGGATPTFAHKSDNVQSVTRSAAGRYTITLNTTLTNYNIQVNTLGTTIASAFIINKSDNSFDVITRRLDHTNTAIEDVDTNFEFTLVNEDAIIGGGGAGGGSSSTNIIFKSDITSMVTVVNSHTNVPYVPTTDTYSAWDSSDNVWVAPRDMTVIVNCTNKSPNAHQHLFGFIFLNSVATGNIKAEQSSIKDSTNTNHSSVNLSAVIELKAGDKVFNTVLIQGANASANLSQQIMTITELGGGSSSTISATPQFSRAQVSSSSRIGHSEADVDLDASQLATDSENWIHTNTTRNTVGILVPEDGLYDISFNIRPVTNTNNNWRDNVSFLHTALQIVKADGTNVLVQETRESKNTGNGTTLNNHLYLDNFHLDEGDFLYLRCRVYSDNTSLSWAVDDSFSFLSLSKPGSGGGGGGGGDAGTSTGGRGNLDVLKNNLENFQHTLPDSIVVPWSTLDYEATFYLFAVRPASASTPPTVNSNWDIYYTCGRGHTDGELMFTDDADGTLITAHADVDQTQGGDFEAGTLTLKWLIDNDRVFYAGGTSDGGGGGSSTFEDLNDTPSSFVGESGKFVKVNDSEDALEFTTFNVNDALGLQEVDGEDNCSEFHLQSDKTTNSSAFEDSSVNNYSILGSNVIHSTSNPKAGFGSSSIQFNGNGQLLVADGSAFKFFHTKIIKNYTIQLWIFKDALNTREPLLLTAANNNEHGVRLIVDSDNKVKFDVMKGLSNATGLSLASTSTVSAQTWHHIAIVNENNTMTLYLDGNQEQSLAWASDASTITPNFGLSIGAGPMGAGQAMVFFNGRMQDIRVDKIAFRSDLLPPTSLLNATCDPSAGKSNIDFKMLRDTPVNYSNAGGKYVKVKDGEDGVEFVEISVGSSTTNEFSTAYVTQDQTSDGFITDLEFGNLVVGRTYRISSTICFESNDASALSRADFYNGTQRIVSLYNKGLTSTVSNSMLFVASDSSISVSGNGLTSNNFIHGLPELSFVQLELPPSVVVEIEDIPVAPVAPPGGGIFSVNDVKMHAGIIDYQDSSNTFSDIDSNAFGGNIIDISDIRLISKIDNTGDQKTFEDLDSRLTSIDKLDLADIRVIAQIDHTGHSRTFEDFDSSLTSFGVLSFADMIINTKIYSTGTDSVMTTDPYTSHDHSFSWTGIN